MSHAVTVIALGEILWDVFPQRTCFGGAPANYACALAELAADRAKVKMISGVGNDALGERALGELGSHGVDIDLVQRPGFPTGRVDIELSEDGSADYRFAADVAWDNLQWSEPLLAAAKTADAICFGTLSQRTTQSAGTIQQLISEVGENCLKLFDINLRFPHVVEAVVWKSLELCHVLKLNDEELRYLGHVCGIGGSELEVLQALQRKFSLQLIALTRGADGATLFDGEQMIHLPGQPAEVVDTVGAGDAFTAVLTLGMLQPGWEGSSDRLRKIGELACRVAAFVCGQPGATPRFPHEFKTTGLF